MSQPADLGQQLEAQREIAIRENVTPTSSNAVSALGSSSSNADDIEEEVKESSLERVDANLNPSNVLQAYPLFDSCFNALSLESTNYINILPNLIFIYSLQQNLADVLIELLCQLMPAYPALLVDHLAQLINTVNNRFENTVFKLRTNQI